MTRPACLTFLTDFGIQDTYVGQMKGIAAGICPDALLIDLTHMIPPQQVLQAAYVWNDAVDAFPENAVHVGVVDPGVGSARKLIAAEIGGRRFVCPDNGMLTVILQRAALQRAVALDNPTWWRSSPSSTFHGRDILTPVAAAWSLGHDLSEFGSSITSPLISLPSASINKGKTSLIGQIVHVDQYGNLITNIEVGKLPNGLSSLKVEVGSFRIDRVLSCYSDVEKGEVLALIGSAGRLEIAVREGNAAEELQVGFGHRVVVRWTGVQL